MTDGTKSFRCWAPQIEAEASATLVTALDHEDAAEDYARRCWNERDGWEWVNGTTIHASDGETTKRFIIVAYEEEGENDRAQTA